MSSPPPLADPAAAAPPDLGALRGELDRLDDAMHDLLMRRAEVVGRIAALGAKGRVPLRPGREASILRRLLGRHAGGLPSATLVRVWRELFAGTTSMQGAFAIAVGDPDPVTLACAREHFGALTPLRSHRTPAQAIAELGAGTAAAAVLPLPAEGEPDAAAWWVWLLHQSDPRLHVVARLPFWEPRPEGAPKARALVVSVAPPDPSGADRTLIGLEVAPDLSRGRLAASLAAGGLSTGEIILRRAPGSAGALVLVDADGFVAEDDPRLAALRLAERPPVVLGAYAVPAGLPTPG